MILYHDVGALLRDYYYFYGIKIEAMNSDFKYWWFRIVVSVILLMAGVMPYTAQW